MHASYEVGEVVYVAGARSIMARLYDSSEDANEEVATYLSAAAWRDFLWNCATLLLVQCEA